jgi:hypothetical protein
MLKRASSFTLMGLILQAAIFSAPVRVRAQTDAEVERTVRARATVYRLGTATRVLVRLHGGRQLRGEIGRITENDFNVKDAGTGADVTVAYADVVEVRRKGKGGLSTGMKLLIIFSVAGFVGGFLNN